MYVKFLRPFITPAGEFAGGHAHPAVEVPDDFPYVLPRDAVKVDGPTPAPEVAPAEELVNNVERLAQYGLSSPRTPEDVAHEAERNRRTNLRNFQNQLAAEKRTKAAKAK